MNGNEVIGQSFLASAQNNDLSLCRFHYLYDVSDLNQGGKFISVSTAIVNNAHIYGLPETSGQGLLIWGSGLYRKSNPYLAYILLDGIEDKDNLRFFAGLEEGTHRPVWSTKEYDAIQLFDHPRIGEFSVSWNHFLGVWIMLYNSDDPRGINFRVAEKPWGPWSPTAVIFEPRIDLGYCHFIHQSWDDGVCDYVHDPGRQAEYGGEYGPCIISRYTKGDSKTSTIYFVMSTWNPYNTFLMRSSLEQKSDFNHTQHSGNPVLIQSRFNQKRSFEVIVPEIRSGLLHYWRNNNNNKKLPWSFATPILTNADKIDAITLIHSRFGDSGNLNGVTRIKDRLFWFWREAEPRPIWRGLFPMVVEDKNISSSRELVTNLTGIPSMTQSKFGQKKANFELVVPLAGGGLAHYWRDNDTDAYPWRAGAIFGVEAGQIDSVTLIQSNFGSPGNLELVARSQDRLLYFWRTSLPPFTWNGPFSIFADGTEISGVTGNPVMIQSRFGNQGNFELAVPLLSGGLAHYWRDNDDPITPWHGPTRIAIQTRFETVSLIQSNIVDPGNLEVVARVGDQLVHCWRDSGPSFKWNGPFEFTSE